MSKEILRSRHNASGFYGVYQRNIGTRCWFAKVHNPHTRKMLYLGAFKTPEAAALRVAVALRTLGKTPYARTAQAVCRKCGRPIWGPNKIENTNPKQKCVRCRHCYNAGRRKSRRETMLPTTKPDAPAVQHPASKFESIQDYLVALGYEIKDDHFLRGDKKIPFAALRGHSLGTFTEWLRRRDG